MNKFYKVTLTVLTTALMSVSAFASPHFNGPDRHQPAKPPHMQHHKAHPSQYHAGPQKAQHNRLPDRGVQKWKVQHKLPAIYQTSKYKVSAYQRHQLSKPDRNQAWYKVDGYYLLTNVKNNTIVKVVKA